MIDEKTTEDNTNEIIHKKIQLWTSEPEGEYAIRLVIEPHDTDIEQFLTTTNPDIKYQRIVAEMDAIEEMKYGWDHVLREFISNYQRTRLEKMNILSSTLPLDASNEFVDTHRYTIKIIHIHDCTYCKEKFDDEEDKRNHELTIHV